MSNFIPEAGIWMNTQRPEWNDANNALVGNGVSMVTLYYLRRFLTFFQNLIDNSTVENIKISNEMVEFYHSIRENLIQFEPLLNNSINDIDRKNYLILWDKQLQIIDNTYIKVVLGQKRTVSMDGLKNLFKLASILLSTRLKPIKKKIIYIMLTI